MTFNSGSGNYSFPFGVGVVSGSVRGGGGTGGSAGWMGFAGNPGNPGNPGNSGYSYGGTGGAGGSGIIIIRYTKSQVGS